MPESHLFKGLSVALATPFTNRGDIDYDAWVRFIEFQIKGGVDHIVVCGTTGESPTVDDDEYARLVEVAVATAKGRVRVVAGAGTNDTKHTIDRGLIAKDAGADGLLVVGPYYNKPPQRGLVAHFSSIVDAVQLPTIVYNVPSRTGSNMLPETASILAAHPGISAFKEASGDMNQIMKVIASLPDHVSVLAGDDSMTLPVIAAGGHGVVSVASNVFPQRMSMFTHACLMGDWDRARDMGMKLLPVFNAMFIESNPIPVKAVLAYRGMMENVLRLPLVPLDEKYWPELRNIIDTIDQTIPLT
jgi:4-hydroxy-tetrahydrodipicolinate synthase